MRLIATAALAATLMSLSGTAAAHKPDFGTAAYDGSSTAYQVADPDISIVVYREATCERPELLLELAAGAGFPLFVQLLTPNIDRLADYRPNFAIIGPGLPRRSIGIDIPSGLGALLFQASEVTPELFNERFTGTQDWILVEETIELPRTGTYYVVAWYPDRQTGKLAVAVGTVEDFGPADLARFGEWRREARAFHELGRFEPPTPVTEQTCPR